MINCWWVWYLAKVHHIRYNLFAETESLSLSVYEPIATLGGVELGGRVWYYVRVLHIRQSRAGTGW